MRKFILALTGIVACLVVVAAGDAIAAGEKLSARTGVVVTPRNFPNHTADDIADMFRLAGEVGSFAVIRLNWNDPNLSDATRTLVGFAEKWSLDSVVEVSPFKTNELKGAELDPPKAVVSTAGRRPSFSNPAVSEPFIRHVLDIAALKPPFLAVATDVNLLALSDPGELAAFADVYARLYPRIKEVSPATKVFVTFQWDAMQGSDAASGRRIIEMFRPRLDVLAFTSEPRRLFEKQGPGGIPRDYYSRIASYASGRAEVFVEVNWPSEGGNGERDQVDFIRAIPDLTAAVRPAMVAWTFLHDVKVLIFTVRAGLISTDGRQKPAFAAVRDLTGDRSPVLAAGGAATLVRAPRSRPAVASRDPAKFGIYTANLDGSGVRAVATSPDREMTHPRISPDGARLTLTRYNKRGRDGKATEEQGYDNTEIMIVNLDGSGLETIIPPKSGVIAANGCWTPDGKSLFFISTDNPQRAPEIRMVDLATREITRLPTPAGLKATDPHWEGNELVFPAKANADGADALWTMNADGSGARQITRPSRTRGGAPGLYGDFDPKLSPDGSKVAFMRIHGGESWQVIVLDRKSGVEQRLSPDGTIEGLPTWSSDGRLLLFRHIDKERLRETGLYTMTPDGRGRKMVPLPRGYLYNHGSFVPGTGSGSTARIIYTGTQMPGM